jgi:peroxiredoxin
VDKRPAAFTEKSQSLWELRRDSRTPAKVAPRFANAPGAVWMVEPDTPSRSLSTLGIVLVYEKDRDGAALITLAAALPGNRPPEYRPVLLDGAKKRYLPERLRGGGSSGRHGAIVVLTRWRMDPKILPADKVALIGIEALTPEYHRLAARAAQERARQEGVEVLPWPEVGQAFDFTLTTADGHKVRGRDLRGKVVLIDCWATWCSPCVALLPQLKELYEKSHKDGLEVIGVSFDEDAAKLKKRCEELGLPWPQVIVPPDEKTRALWQEATGVGGIPQLFLIDRDGVLRAHDPARLKDEVARLLQQTPGKKP